MGREERRGKRIYEGREEGEGSIREEKGGECDI
jgi:hypothetical protein